MNCSAIEKNFLFISEWNPAKQNYNSSTKNFLLIPENPQTFSDLLPIKEWAESIREIKQTPEIPTENNELSRIKSFQSNSNW